MANNAHLELIDYLEDKYREHNMKVNIEEFPMFEECKFLISFFINDLQYELIHSCMSYRDKNIDAEEVGKIIELIESKISSKIEVKTVEVKPEYKPLKCPCCGGSINSISFCINDDYVKCEYCDTILTSKVKSQEIFLI